MIEMVHVEPEQNVSCVAAVGDASGRQHADVLGHVVRAGDLVESAGVRAKEARTVLNAATHGVPPAAKNRRAGNRIPRHWHR